MIDERESYERAFQQFQLPERRGTASSADATASAGTSASRRAAWSGSRSSSRPCGS